MRFVKAFSAHKIKITSFAEKFVGSFCTAKAVHNFYGQKNSSVFAYVTFKKLMTRCLKMSLG